MGDEEVETNQPIGKTWSSDWDAATLKADARAEQKEAVIEKEISDERHDEGLHSQGENERQEGGQEQSPSGSEEDGTGQAESSSGQESTEPDGQSQTGEEPLGDDLSDERKREISREGGERRDGSEVEARPRSERLKALRDEAKDLGLEFEGNMVMVSERAKFREEKRNMRNKIQLERSTFEAEAKAVTENLERDLVKSKRMEAAIAANDLDEIAQAAGLESWNHLSEQALKRQMNPEHKELMLHRREKREREERLAREGRAHEQAQVSQRQEQARVQYRGDLQAKIAKSKKYSAFADDPLFVTGVLQHQEKNWDGEETITIDEASALAMRDARAIYDKLHQRFGSRTASQSEKQPASGASAAEKPGRRSPPKTVSQSEVADVSEDDSPDELDPKAWARKWGARLAESNSEA